MAHTPETTPEIELLKRYRQGACTPEEIRRVDQWFDAHERETVPLLLRNHSVQQVNQAVMQSIWSKRGKQRSGAYFLKVAAILLLTVFAGLFTYRSLHPEPMQTVQYTTISTKAGQRKTILLPDSSQISLNNQSAVRFPTNFSGKTRTVSLTGEAFFNVRHDTKRPFLVNTGVLQVQVLGTSFNVKAFPGETVSKVTVASGKVGVYRKAGEPARMLLPGEQLSYDQHAGQFTKQKVIAENHYAWQTGILVFKGENLGEIARQLERWYDVKITINNTRLIKEQFNIMQHNESLYHVLKSLSLSGEGFQFRIKEGKVIIW